MVESEAGTQPEAAPLGELSVALLMLLFGAVTVGLIRTFDAPAIGRLIMRVPCQIVRTGRRIVYRLLSWNPWQHVFLRAVDALRHPLRC